MESDFILISELNDFIFCPYSIYLHNVYMEADDGLYHASPQTRGRMAHETTDNKSSSTRRTDLFNLPIYSERLRLMGKIDVYKADRKLLIERKYQLKQIYKGQIYQLWAQMYCMRDMGYDVEHIAFYEISSNRMINIDMPSSLEEQRFVSFIQNFHSYNPEQPLTINENKCRHCIYCSLCDKTTMENVYS